MNFHIGNNPYQSWTIPCTRKRASLIRFGRFSTRNIDTTVHDTIHQIVPPDKCTIVVNDKAHIAMYTDSTAGGRASHVFKTLMKLCTTMRGKSDTQSYKIYSHGRRVVMGMFIMMISLQKIGGNSIIEVPLKTLGVIHDLVYIGYRLYSYVDVKVMGDCVRIHLKDFIDDMDDSFLIQLIHSYKNVDTDISCCETPLFYKQVFDEITVIITGMDRRGVGGYTGPTVRNPFNLQSTSQSPKHWGLPTQTASQQY